MSYDNRVIELNALDEEILKEVVREGEAMLAAQLSVATAADQRAMTFAGLLIAAATAATGGVVALILTANPNWTAALIGAFYAIFALVAAGFAIWSAKPNDFSFPGNEPSSWHPEQWLAGKNGPHNLKQARVEQAVTLQSQIGKNKATLALNAARMRKAVAIGFTSTVVAAVAILFWGVSQWLTPAQKTEPKSSAQPIHVICQLPIPGHMSILRGPNQGSERAAEKPPSTRAKISESVRRAVGARLPVDQACKPSHPTPSASPLQPADRDPSGGQSPHM